MNTTIPEFPTLEGGWYRPNVRRDAGLWKTQDSEEIEYVAGLLKADECEGGCPTGFAPDHGTT